MFYGNTRTVFHLLLGLFLINVLSPKLSKRLSSPRASPKKADLGDDIKLHCRYPNGSDPMKVNEKLKLKWFKDNRLLIKSSVDKRSIIRKNGKVLKFKKIVLGDAGVYSCRNDRNGIIVTYNISVQQLPSQSSLRWKYPERMIKQSNTVKPAGNDLTFDCHAIGAGPIRYKWFKDGQPLLHRRVDSNFVTDKADLKLKGLVRSDGANYTCVVENKYGNISSFMVLHVQERVRASPYIEKATMKNQTRYVGDNVSIVCYELITGTIPDFRWLKWTGNLNETLLTRYLGLDNGVGSVDEDIARVIHGDFYRPTKKDAAWPNGNNRQGAGRQRQVVRGVECLLTNVTKEDSGFYTCIATNHIGTDYASMYLNVIDRVEDDINVTKIVNDDDDSMQIIIAVLGVLVLIALFILVWLFVTWKLKGHRNINHDDVALANIDKKLNIVTEKRIQSSGSIRAPLLSVGSGRVNSESTGIYGDLDDAIPIPYDPEWEIDRNCLQIQETLGEGAFGVVVKAQAVGLERCQNKNSTVAIKMLKADATDNELMDLLSEMDTMKRIGQHINIINFLGCCTEKKPIYVVVEYAPQDNLRQFLRSKRPPPSDSDQRMEPLLSVKDMVSFALQIAKGMEYLASKKCIHRDLAARNVLVAEDNVMKIADFGLARSVHEIDYYRKTTDGRLPVKWLAIEALFDRVYTTQSDVWAFGVLLWEIFTLGGSPYPGIPIERLFDLLKSGFRMEKPQICPLEMYEIMVKCWFENPTHRPSFSQLVGEIEGILEMLTSQDYIEVLAGSMTSLNSSPNDDDDESSEAASYSDSSSSNVFPSVPGLMNVS